MNENEQLALIDGESEEALLLPQEEVQKRYTGRTADRLRQKRNHILDLLGIELPIEEIAQRTESSTRIVKLLGAKYSQTVAGNLRHFSQLFKAKAARFLFLAQTKEGDAKFSDLIAAASFLSQRGMEMEAASYGQPQPNEGSVNVEEVNPALVSAREFVKQLNAPRPECERAVVEVSA